MNPTLKHSLTVLQHRGSSIPGLSPGSVSSGKSLSHHFPLVSFSRLPFLSPVRHQELNEQLWVKQGCWGSGCADDKGAAGPGLL